MADAYADSVKAQVIAALMAGQGVQEVANQYNLNRTTVYRWRKSLDLPEIAAENRAQGRDFSEMIGKYLEELLKTGVEQQIFFRRPDWLMTQSAADLAVLHGVSVDKGIRLLEAAAKANMQPEGA